MPVFEEPILHFAHPRVITRLPEYLPQRRVAIERKIVCAEWPTIVPNVGGAVAASIASSTTSRSSRLTGIGPMESEGRGAGMPHSRGTVSLEVALQSANSANP